MSLIRKHVAVLQAWACLALVFTVLVESVDWTHLVCWRGITSNEWTRDEY